MSTSWLIFLVDLQGMRDKQKLQLKNPWKKWDSNSQPSD